VIRAIALIGLDSASWITALAVATMLRYEFEFARIDLSGLLIAIGMAVGAQILWGLLIGLYPGKWELASFRETGALGAGGLLIAIGLLTWVGVGTDPHPIPLSITVAGPALFVLNSLAARFLMRLARETRAVSRHVRSKRALLFGAGEAGHETAAALLRDRSTEILPVAFLDDDPTRTRLRINGCRVVGGRSRIAAAAREFGADTMIITMPSASRSAVAAIARSAREAGLTVLILPRIALLFSSELDPGMIRPLSYADFLGRDPVRLDIPELASSIRERSVLITGAGGSIGSELAVAVSRFDPSRLYLLDRDENALHALQLRLEGRALLDSDRLIVADIRDARRLHEVFAECTPDVVFHAAALKHVTFLERHPAEAVKTNVFGTANVLEMAALHGAQLFVNVSTDKAADPVNVLGMTKRIGEMLTAGHALNGMTAMSVRFGNVLGSTGSVIPTFRAQILRGGPITITHPDVTRFFMTIEEAAYLVIQAAAIGGNGEVVVLEMGKPVRIVDLARHLVEELNPTGEIPVEYTGLRPGEKLHEVLVGPADRFTGSPHEGMNSYAVPPLNPEIVFGIDVDDTEKLRSRLQWIIEAHSNAAVALDAVALDELD
jgi:FlaA1/EpsC-like NDP-sugar epimerase